VVTGRPAELPAIASLTLDADDARVAMAGLMGRRGWQDAELTEVYQKAFARQNGSAHAFAYMAGRVALSAALEALDLAPGDEVVIPGYTCVVVPNAARYLGLKVVFADIETDTYGPDLSSVRACITPRTRALVIHHLYGLVCRDLEALVDLARSRGIYLIEDCAHAMGARYQGKRVGNFGDLGFYSTERSKCLSTIQGGMVVTSDDRLAQRLATNWRRASLPQADLVARQLQNVLLDYYQWKHPGRWLLGPAMEHAWGAKRLVTTTQGELAGQRPPGYGARMPSAIAAVGLTQLRKLEHYNECRRRRASRWAGWCASKGYPAPLEVAESTPVYLRYPIMVEPELKRDVSWAARELQVRAGVWFATNLHPSPERVAGCPNADRAVSRCVNFYCLGSPGRGT
jgi:dTDP-4-amino-4,6-dideoxygalactose transaminase